MYMQCLEIGKGAAVGWWNVSNWQPEGTLRWKIHFPLDAHFEFCLMSVFCGTKETARERERGRNGYQLNARLSVYPWMIIKFNNFAVIAHFPVACYVPNWNFMNSRSVQKIRTLNIPKQSVNVSFLWNFPLAQQHPHPISPIFIHVCI